MPPTILNGDIAPFLALTTLIAAICLLSTTLYRFIRPKHVYFRRAHLLTPAELRFFHTLQSIAGKQFFLLTKVRIADLVDVRGLTGRRWWKAFASLSQKHLDFVVANRETLQVLAAIELDDNSHQRRDRRQRDALINAVCQQAQIPLIRFKPGYSSQQVRDTLYKAIHALGPELLNGFSASRPGSPPL